MNAPVERNVSKVVTLAAAAPGPCTTDPLRGLKHLSRVALLGRVRMLEIAATPATFVWRDISVASTITLLAGGPGEGKTTLLFLILAARLNTGAPVSVLGRIVEPAPVGKWIVLVEGEHGEGSTVRKLVRSMRLLAVDDMALERVIVIARKAVRLGSPEWTDITKMVAAGIVSDIAIDTIARVAPANADNEADQVAIFDTVATTIESAPLEADRPSVWVVAHTRKNNTAGDVSDVSGSAQRTGQADSVLLVKGERVDGRIVSSRVTFAKLREDPDDYPEPATFSIVRDASGDYIHTSNARDAESDVRPLETRIVEQLKLGPKTSNGLRDVLGRNNADIEAAISNLFQTKDIVTTNVMVRGVPRKSFTLRKSHRTLTGLGVSEISPDASPDGFTKGRDSR